MDMGGNEDLPIQLSHFLAMGIAVYAYALKSGN